MLAEGRDEDVALAEGADWQFATGELNKAQLVALSAAERAMREKAEAETEKMRAKVRATPRVQRQRLSSLSL
jgi:hypothetical protein